MTGRELAFTKAHGAGNDFIVIEDRDGVVEPDLSPAAVTAMCDRHLGLGADGMLRVVRTAAAPADAAPVVAATAAAAAAGGASVPEWFMDYRNADGSPAQMCGNGVRVFAAYLRSHGLVDAAGPVSLLTRAGIRTVHDSRDGLPHGWTTVSMGPVVLDQPPATMSITVGGRSFPARRADVGNPHAVVLLGTADFAALPGIGRLVDPTAEPASAFGDGFNLEFAAVTGRDALRVRIIERGVGETLACGTGVCAAVAVAAGAGLLGAREVASGVAVSVPGGSLDVRLQGSAPRFDGAELSGPNATVATGFLVIGR